MKKLPENLQEYEALEEKEQAEFLDHSYNKEGLTWAAIATKLGTYTNRILRDAKRLNVASRDRSKAQSLALASGRHPHPTKDKGHSEAAKVNISESVAKKWEDMSEVEREKKRLEARERWESKTPEEIRDFRHAAGEGVREAAKNGSRLEKYLLTGLIAAGFKVEFHKEQWVVREKLQLDLYIPELLTAIEVDGPSHFKEIWGVDNLVKNQQRDAEKTGLLLERGCVIVRVRQTKSLSNKYMRDILTNLVNTLNSIKTKFPDKGNRIISIGE